MILGGLVLRDWIRNGIGRRGGGRSYVDASVKCKKRQKDRRKLGPLDVVAVGEIGYKCNAEESTNKSKSQAG